MTPTPLRRRTPLKKSRKRLKIRVRKQDVEWAQSIKMRDTFQCRRCGKRYPPVMQTSEFAKALRGLHACHIFGRSRRSTRWELDNGLTLCMGCHLFFHAHPLDMILFARTELGEERFERLRRLANGQGPLLESHQTDDAAPGRTP